MFRKLLVANRGEIAIRAFRAAYELDIATVAVFAYEDRNSLHRAKADESYLIGERGHPVRAYLSVEEIVRAARQAGADAVYPGYGFLSENPRLAQACAEAGITFVGPPAEVLHLTGDKSRAVAAARAAGSRSCGSSARRRTSTRSSRRRRRSGSRCSSRPSPAAAAAGCAASTPRTSCVSRVGGDAGGRAAFGDQTVFLERAVVKPRHIEVQVLADAAGNVVHLYERDCSVQRRHQKVIEIAPAPNLDPEIRDRICADAVAFARRSATSTPARSSSSLDAQGRHVFIEMNPRIQVEHTVTEQVTDVDLVIAQLRVAAGRRCRSCTCARSRSG